MDDALDWYERNEPPDPDDVLIEVDPEDVLSVTGGIGICVCFAMNHIIGIYTAMLCFTTKTVMVRLPCLE